MKKLIVFLSLAIISLNVFSQDLYKVSKADVKFTSDAKLELIEAETTDAQGVVNNDENTFAFRIPMNTFRGFNSSMQRTHFNTNYLETAKYPYTIFEGKIIEDVDFSKPGNYMVRGKGKFTCHGKVQERIIKCKVKSQGGKITITSGFSVFLEDHNIEIPTVVYQKIAEEITVDLTFVLTK
ncbi:MAG: YceI family protein [Salinivirgaceae bacterium]|nr:MAG: YceI family protein [Salinivirgaceae bacterium]